MDLFGIQSQMSIFEISKDNMSMYPSMYRVMHVEKNCPTLVSSKSLESVHIFLKVGVPSTKSAPLENERLRQASDHQRSEGFK